MKAYRLRRKLALVREDFRGEILIAGDLHGDLEAFEKIKEVFYSRPDPLLIFLGDYADRGPHGLEVSEGVGELMRERGGRVLGLKGNHEDYRDGVPYFSPCDLMDEVEVKKGLSWTDYFSGFEREFLSKFHLAVLIPKFAVLVRGGISSKIRGERPLSYSNLQQYPGPLS